MRKPIKEGRIKLTIFIKNDLKPLLAHLKANGATNESIMLAGMKHVEERIAILKNRTNETKAL